MIGISEMTKILKKENNSISLFQTNRELNNQAFTKLEKNIDVQV